MYNITYNLLDSKQANFKSKGLQSKIIKFLTGSDKNTQNKYSKVTEENLT